MAAVRKRHAKDRVPGLEHRHVPAWFAASRVRLHVRQSGAEKLPRAPMASFFGRGPHTRSRVVALARVSFGVLEPGDTILGMSLAHGGHLTHGSTVNMSGKLYRAMAYGWTRPRKSTSPRSSASRPNTSPS